MISAIGTTLLILSLLLGGGSAAVAAANSSLPDQPLYPVKTWSEELRANLVVNEQTRLDFALQLMDRRAGELQSMFQEGKTPPESLSVRLQTQIDRALQMASAQPNEKATEALVRVQDRLQVQEQALLKINDPADPQAEALLQHTRSMVQDRLKVCQEGIQDPDQLRDRLRDQDRDGEQMLRWILTPEPGAYSPGPAATGTPPSASRGTPIPDGGDPVKDPERERNMYQTREQTDCNGCSINQDGYGSDNDGGGVQNPWVEGTPEPGYGSGPGQVQTTDGVPGGPGPEQQPTSGSEQGSGPNPQTTPSGDGFGDTNAGGDNQPGGDDGSGGNSAGEQTGSGGNYGGNQISGGNGGGGN